MSVTRRCVLGGLVAIPAAIALPIGKAAAESGRFVGTVVAQWGDNGRDMILIQPFEFIGPDGQRWPVPAGASVNGASIPRVFWSVIGGPFEGLYRNASVVHDYYCGIQSRNYREVHRVFYDAMVASGVDSSTAWLMFQAVNRFGPKWTLVPPPGGCNTGGQGEPVPCTRGFTPRSVIKPGIDKQELESFLSEVQDKANPKDVAKLRNELKNLN